MTMAKPTLSSKIGTATKLLTYAENVLQKSKDNADLFTDAAETILELEAAIEAYRNSLTESAYRDMRQVVIKNQQAEVLKQILYRYSLYVETVANGDPNLILASGFMPNRSTVQPAIGMSPKANDLRAEVKHTGTNSIHLRVAPWRPARYYQFEFRKAESMNGWTPVLSTKSRTVIDGLEERQEYEFRVTYLGTDPRPNYSETVRCFVV